MDVGEMLGVGPGWKRGLTSEILWPFSADSLWNLLGCTRGGSGLSGPACRLSTFRNLNLLTNEEVECDQETRRHGAELLLKSWAGITGQADFAATKSLLSRGVNTEVQKSSLPAHV